MQIEAPFDYLSMDDPTEKLPTMEEELTPFNQEGSKT